MQCPECGYQLTPFDKDCPRCKNFASKGLKPAETTPVELHFDHSPNDLPVAEPSSATGELTSEPALKTKNNRVLIGVFFVVVMLLLGYWFLTSKQSHVQESAATSAVQQGDTKIQRVKDEGVQQCIAGDEEGCHYAMDKLRDADDYDGAEFLKLHIIVSLTLNDEQSKYRDNAGATIVEYEAYAKKLSDEANLLAVEGNSDYKVLAQGQECAEALAAYGKSHHLTGRY